MSETLPLTFHVDIQRSGLLTYTLSASQILPVAREKAFQFFEDPGNLYDITPVWLDLCILNKKNHAGVHTDAEFDYTMKFLGLKMLWRSRIIDYSPPKRFTDIQVKGPYKSWVHLHELEKVPEGTLMRDEVTYTLYLPAVILHPVVIKTKLMDIFRYRAVKIAEWARLVTAQGSCRHRHVQVHPL